MKRRRVKITGIGPVTPAGIGKDAFWRGILEPVSRIKPYYEIGDEYGPFVAACVSDFKIGDFIQNTLLLPKGVSRQSLFAATGAVLALQDAKITREELATRSCAITVGSSLMDFGGIGASIDGVQKRGIRGAQPRVLYGMGISSIASVINAILELSARTMAVSTQCSAGLDAIGYAASLVATGEVDIAICGGTEAPLYKFPMLELRAADLTPGHTEMADRLARPYDLWRTTGVVSEGACMFVLEPESSSRRGYSWISSYAVGNDVNDDLCGGMAVAAKIAMAEASISSAQIDAISGWGPGHKLVDRGEAQAMLRLFSSAVEELPAVSIKGAIGTALGAAPAIQTAAAALAQATRMIPPTVNWDHPDPACPLNLSSLPRAIDHQFTLVNAHGAGGVNGCLILERC